MRTGARTRRIGVSRGGHDRFEKAEEAVESRGWIGLDEDIRMEHRNFGAYSKDALHRQSVCMILVTACKCLLC